MREVARFTLSCLIVLLVLTLSSAAAPVEVKRNGDRIDVLIGGRPFTTYYFDAADAKPYLFPLRSARGMIVTRSFPMVINKHSRRRQ